MNIACIVPAAGLSRRLGRPKQLAEAGGRILLAWTIQSILATPLHPVILVLGHLADEITTALSGSKGLPSSDLSTIRIVYNEDYESGQASSIKTGLNALPVYVDSAVFWMGDQIGVRPHVVQQIVTRAQLKDSPGVVRPRYDGREGGPVWWRKRLFSSLQNLKGDEGGRTVLKDLSPNQIAYVDFPKSDEPMDLDTEQDFLRWTDLFINPKA